MKTSYEIYKSLEPNTLIDGIKKLRLVNIKWCSEKEIKGLIIILDEEIKNYKRMFKIDDESQTKGIILGLILARDNLKTVLSIKKWSEEIKNDGYWRFKKINWNS